MGTTRQDMKEHITDRLKSLEYMIDIYKSNVLLCRELKKEYKMLNNIIEEVYHGERCY